MIPRYEVPEISSLWDDHAKFTYFLKVELAILEAQEGGHIPRGSADKIRKLAQINPQRIEEIEKTTRHDVIAFCTSITEKLPPELGKFFHYGVTSSDIIDTALALQIRDSLTFVLDHLGKLTLILFNRAKETMNWPCMGRSHGMFAEPMSFGQKLLGHWCEIKRREKEYIQFFKNEITGQFSGAVGNYTIIKPEQEKLALQVLGLKCESVSTQIIPRDRIAKLLNLGALLSCALERLCIELRHLHRSEVGEIFEGFTPGQKGSSIMPHKKNPISAENITGISRVLRSHAQVALENTLLWHERDISHSSAERLILPDHFGLLVYAISRIEKTIRDLEFNRDKIEAKVFHNSSYLSSYYLHQLINNYSLKREDLYPLIQQASFETEKSLDGSPEAFHRHLSKLLEALSINMDKIPVPTAGEIQKIYLGEVDKVFKRAQEEYL